ncbi:MAG: DUF4191 domain-containing protein [Mobilicoccus sp.]|nr:DUF4191 domain-containing protein [Mobilicoccus sp.]
MASTSTKGATAAKKPKEKKPRKERFTKIKQIWSLAKHDDPRIGLKFAGIALAITLVGLLIGLAIGRPIYMTFIFLPLGVLAAFIFLSRRAERAAYGALEGRPGAGGAVLQGLRRGWSYIEEPVGIDGGRGGSLNDAAMVFRAVGRPGVVLIGEGPQSRAQKLLLNERRKVNRLTPNVPVTLYRLGSGTANEKSGEIVLPARDVVKRMRKLPKSLTKHEVSEVDRRLRALGAQRPPIPQGIDPNRVRSMGRGGQFR